MPSVNDRPVSLPRIRSATPHDSAALCHDPVPKEKWDDLIEAVKKLKQNAESQAVKTGNRSAAGGHQGHQHTPALISALVEDAVKLTLADKEAEDLGEEEKSKPGGGFSDVGLHTGGMKRDTCWALVREVAKFILSHVLTPRNSQPTRGPWGPSPEHLVVMTEASLRLWLLERQLALLTPQTVTPSAVTAVMDMLEQTAVSGAELADCVGTDPCPRPHGAAPRADDDAEPCLDLHAGDSHDAMGPCQLQPPAKASPRGYASAEAANRGLMNASGMVNANADAGGVTKSSTGSSSTPAGAAMSVATLSGKPSVEEDCDTNADASSGVEAFAERLRNVRLSLDGLLKAREEMRADMFRVPEEGCVEAPVLTEPRVVLPAQPVVADRSNSDLLGVANRNLCGLPLLPPHATVRQALGWLQEPTMVTRGPASCPELPSQLALRGIEKVVFGAAVAARAREGPGWARPDIDTGELITLVDVYRRVLGKFLSMDGPAARMQVEVRSRETLMVWVAFCFADAHGCVEHPLLQKYGVALRWEDLGHLVLGDRLAVDAALAVGEYLRARTNRSRDVFTLRGARGPSLSACTSLGWDSSTMSMAAKMAEEEGTALGEQIRSLWRAEQEDAQKRVEGHWKEVLRKQKLVRELREKKADLKSQLRDLESEKDQAESEEAATRKHFQAYNASCTMCCPYHVSYVSDCSWKQEREERETALTNATRETLSKRDAVNSCKRKIRSTENALEMAEESPPPVYQPLPSDEERALAILLLLNMPTLLRQVAQLAFTAQQMLLPYPWKDERGRWDITGAIREPKFTHGWQDYYNDHQSCQYHTPAETRRGSSGALLLGTRVEPPAKVGPQYVEQCSQPSEGIWHPDALIPSLGWKGCGIAPTASKDLFNPFAHVPHRAVVDYHTELLPTAEPHRLDKLQWALPQYVLPFGPADSDERHSATDTWLATRGNIAIADQSVQPRWLTKPAYLAFGALRAYPSSQTRRICVALRDKLLPLDQPAVHTLLRMAAYHVGKLDVAPPAGRRGGNIISGGVAGVSEANADVGSRAGGRTGVADGGNQACREQLFPRWHTDLWRGSFANTLCAELRVLLGELRDTPRRHGELMILAELAGYVGERHAGCLAVARGFGQVARKWGDELEGQLADSDNKALLAAGVDGGTVGGMTPTGGAAIGVSTAAGEAAWGSHVGEGGQRRQGSEGVTHSRGGKRERQAGAIRSRQRLFYLYALLCYSSGPLSVADASAMVELAVLIAYTRVFEGEDGGMGKSGQVTSARSPPVTYASPYNAGSPSNAGGLLDPKTLAPGLSVRCQNVMAGRVDDLLRVLEQEGGSGARDRALTSAFQRVVQQGVSDDLAWEETKESRACFHAKCKDTRDGYPRLYSINVLSGAVLVDGSPPGRLPAAILEHRLYKSVFGDMSFEVVATAQGVYGATRPVCGRWYWFAMLEGRLVGVEYHDNEDIYTNEGNVDPPPGEGSLMSEDGAMSQDCTQSEGRGCLLELLDPREAWASELPVRLRELHSHWLCRDSAIHPDGLPFVTFRPRDFRQHQAAFIMECHAGGGGSCWRVPEVLCREPYAALVGARRPRLTQKLMLAPDGKKDPLLRALSKFEPLRFLHIFHENEGSSAGPRVYFHLPRSKLEFVLQEGRVDSLDYRGYSLASTQQLVSPVTLPEFTQYLVLQATGSTKQGRSWVLPPGRVSVHNLPDTRVVMTQGLVARAVEAPEGGGGRVVALQGVKEEEGAGKGEEEYDLLPSTFIERDDDDCDVSLSTHTYTLHGRWPLLEAADVPARLHLAAVYAGPGSLAPLPGCLGGMAGLEAALALVRQCRVSKPLAPQDVQQLRRIAGFGVPLLPALTIACHALERASLELRFLYTEGVLGWRPSLEEEWVDGHQIPGASVAHTAYLHKCRRMAPHSRRRLTQEEAAGELGCAGGEMWAGEAAGMGPGRAMRKHGVLPVGACPVAADYVPKMEAELRSYLQVRGTRGTAAPPLPAYPLSLPGPTVLSREMHDELRDSWDAHMRAPAVTLAGGHTTASLLERFCDKLVEVSKKRTTVERFITGALSTMPSSSGWHAAASRMLASASLLPGVTLRDVARMACDRTLIAHCNPFLSRPAKAAVYDAILVWLQLCVLEDKLGRLVAHATAEDERMLLQELEVVRAWDVCQHPLWLVLEADRGFQIRPNQYAVARYMMDHPGAIVQLNMGEGKTRVILPMLALHWANGSNTVRLNFLASLLDEAHDYLHRCLCAGVLGRRLTLLPFNRDVGREAEHTLGCGVAHEMTANDTRALAYHIDDLTAAGGILLVAPEHRLSLKLKRLELAARPGNEETCRLLEQLDNRSLIDILDESDELLHHRRELVYACGAPVALPNGPNRWAAIQALLLVLQQGIRTGGPIRDVLAQPGVCVGLEVYSAGVAIGEGGPCQVAGTGSGLEKAGFSHGEFIPVRLIPGDPLDECLPDLQKCLLDGLMCNPPYEMRWLRDVERDVERDARIMRYVTDRALEDAAALLESIFPKGGANYEDGRATLRMLRGLLAGDMLFRELEKRHLVEYGVDRRAGSTRKKHLAVPFRAHNQPSDRSEWAHPDVALLLTTLAYYHDGLTLDQMVDCLRTLLKNPPSAQTEFYNGWLAMCERPGSGGDMPPSWLNRGHNDGTSPAQSQPRIAEAGATESQPQPQPQPQPQAQDSYGGETAADRGAEAEEWASIDMVEKVDLTNALKLALLHRRLGRNMGVINFWLSYCLFPRETNQFEKKMSASAWDLAQASGDKGFVVGFSGTNDLHRLMPLQVHQNHLDLPELQGTSGKMLALLLREDGKQGSYTTLAGDAGPLWRATLDSCVARRAHVLLDAGAFLVGVSNQEAAEYLLPNLPASISGPATSGVRTEGFQGVGYYETAHHEWMVLDRSGWCVPLARSPMSPADIFFIFDESRCRGTDLKLRPDALALVTLSASMTKDKLMQAAGRMRQLDKGQRVLLVGNDELSDKVVKANGLVVECASRQGGRGTAPGSGHGSREFIRPLHVMRVVMANTVEATQAGLIHATRQGAHFALTHGATWHRALVDEDVALDSMYESVLAEQPASQLVEKLAERVVADSGNRLDGRMAAMMEGIRDRGRKYGSDFSVVVSQVALGGECERELEMQAEQEVETEVQLPMCTPRAEVTWDYASIFRACSSQELPAQARVLSLRDAMACWLVPPGLGSMPWSDKVFMTYNFLQGTVENDVAGIHSSLPVEAQLISVRGGGAKLNDFLRAVDPMLYFPDTGEVLLLSEREADAVLELLWERDGLVRPSSAGIITNLASKAKRSSGTTGSRVALFHLSFACRPATSSMQAEVGGRGIHRTVNGTNGVDQLELSLPVPSSFSLGCSRWHSRPPHNASSRDAGGIGSALPVSTAVSLLLFSGVTSYKSQQQQDELRRLLVADGSLAKKLVVMRGCFDQFPRSDLEQVALALPWETDAV
eukprot:jgi/Mesvir1/27575/Mv07320-RA.1